MVELGAFTKTLLATSTATDKTIEKCFLSLKGPKSFGHRPKLNFSSAYVEQCRQVFEHCDRNGDGSIQDREMVMLFEKLGLDSPESKVRAFMQQKNGHPNRVSFEEFIYGCHSWFGTNPESVKTKTLKKGISTPLLSSYELLQRKSKQTVGFEFDENTPTPVEAYHRPSLSRSQSMMIEKARHESAVIKTQSEKQPSVRPPEPTHLSTRSILGFTRSLKRAI